jgi:hypothetical protein
MTFRLKTASGVVLREKTEKITIFKDRPSFSVSTRFAGLSAEERSKCSEVVVSWNYGER